MKKYKVYEVETKAFGAGKEMKKLVLQGEGDQYPSKGVAMWSDHPLYATIAEGQEHELDIEVKDSTTPNPHGGFYKNRSVLKPGQAPQTPQNSSVTEMAIKTHVSQEIAPVMHALKVIQEKLGIDPQGKPYPYPSNQNIDTAKSGDVPDDGAPEITDEDIPF